VKSKYFKIGTHKTQNTYFSPDPVICDNTQRSFRARDVMFPHSD